jgi:hypothetical protein
MAIMAAMSDRMSVSDEAHAVESHCSRTKATRVLLLCRLSEYCRVGCRSLQVDDKIFLRRCLN